MGLITLFGSTRYYITKNQTNATTNLEKQTKKIKNRESPEIFDNQINFQSPDTYAFFQAAIGSFLKRGNVHDELCKRLEQIGLLIVTLQGCTDTPSLVSAVGLFVSGIHSSSITLLVKEYITELFLLTNQSDSKDHEDDLLKTKGWRDLIKDFQANWTKVVMSPLFSHISRLLGMLVTLELCEASSVTFSIRKFNLFAPDLTHKHSTAIDFVGAMLDTVVYFIDVMHACWTNASLKPILDNPESGDQLEADYQQIMIWSTHVQQGNLELDCNISRNEYIQRLHETALALRVFCNSLPQGPARTIISRRVETLATLQIEVDAMLNRSSSREAPFGLCLSGPSGQGKSYLVGQMVTALCQSANLPTDGSYRCVLNPEEQYQSQMSTDKIAVILDDVANQKQDVSNTCHATLLTQICTNVVCSPNKADVGSKGKTFWNNAITVLTTNKRDLDAGKISNCPYALQRRFLDVGVMARPEYMRSDGTGMIDAGKCRAYSEAHPDEFPDCYLITLSRAVKPQRDMEVAPYKIIKWNGRKMKNVSLKVAMQYLMEEFQNHRINQKAAVASINKVVVRQVCNVDKCPQLRGLCHKHSVEESLAFCESHNIPDRNKAPREMQHMSAQHVHAIRESVPEAEIMDNQLGPYNKTESALKWGYTKIGNVIYSAKRDAESSIDQALSSAIYVSALYFLNTFDWLLLIPTPWLASDWCQKLCMLGSTKKLRRHFIRNSVILWICFALTCAYLPIWCSPICFIVSLTWQMSMHRRVRESYVRDLLRRNGSISEAVRDFRDTVGQRVLTAGGAIVSIYYIAKLYRQYKHNLDNQGDLNPTTQEQIIERSEEVNPWIPVTKLVEIPAEREARTTTIEQVKNKLNNHIVYGTLSKMNSEGIMEKVIIRGLVIRTGVIVVPGHVFDHQSDMLIQVWKKGNNDNDSYVNVTISKALSVVYPNQDLRVCFISSMAPVKDLLSYFPDESPDRAEFDLQYREKNGRILSMNGIANLCDVGNRTGLYRAYKYDCLSDDTFNGLCGAIMVSRVKAVVLGMHIGGRAGTPYGCSAAITRPRLLQCIDELRTYPSVVIGGCIERFPNQIDGSPLYKAELPHRKSAIRHLTGTTQIDYHGTCGGITTFKSDAKDTKISDAVTEITGVPNTYCEPISNPRWHVWQQTLDAMSTPGTPMSPTALIWAVNDYLNSELISRFRTKCGSLPDRPLTEEENFAGIDGVKFIDAIKLSTSGGFEFPGPKHKYVRHKDPDRWNEIVDLANTPRRDLEWVPVAANAIQRFSMCYGDDKRAYPIVKATQKDEILSKPKGRIFFAGSLAFTWKIRELFLPIAARLQYFPLLSECAVGVNAHSQEWHQLDDHMFKYGSDNLLGGDYKGYDQKMSSQLILAAVHVMIRLAKEMGYPEDALKQMEALSADLVFPMVAMNGDLISLTEGTHISGNPLTVVINSIVGSLHSRIYFHDVVRRYPELKKYTYRDLVNVMHYGDDEFGSAHPILKGKFTVKGFAEFLAKHNQTYTMPDKTSTLLDNIPVEQFEFLKRFSVYHEKLGCKVGALSETSIFKMLHMYLRPKGCLNTEELACAENIDTALREWFNHGREVYELRRTQMRAVASRVGISHLCTQLDTTYEMCVERWHDVYGTTRA